MVIKAIRPVALCRLPEWRHGRMDVSLSGLRNQRAQSSTICREIRMAQKLGPHMVQK